MAIKNISEDIILVTLPEEPQLCDDLTVINEMIGKRCDCDVVVDFLRAEILTSSNICNLIILNKLLTGCGYRLILANVSLPVKGILSVIGLAAFFTFAKDRYVALDLLQVVAC